MNKIPAFESVLGHWPPFLGQDFTKGHDEGDKKLKEALVIINASPSSFPGWDKK